MYAISVLVLLPKLSFRYIISAWFFHKNIPYLLLYQLTKFQCHIFFPSWDIVQNVLLSSYLGKRLCHKLYVTNAYVIRCILNYPLRQWLIGKYWEEVRNPKIWISRECKELLRWNKMHFSWLLRTIIWWKNEKEWTQVLRSFLIKVLRNRIIYNVTMPS